MKVLHLHTCLSAIVGFTFMWEGVGQDWCCADRPLCCGGSHSEAGSLGRGWSLQVFCRAKIQGGSNPPCMAPPKKTERYINSKIQTKIVIKYENVFLYDFGVLLLWTLHFIWTEDWPTLRCFLLFLRRYSRIPGCATLMQSCVLLCGLGSWQDSSGEI